MKTGCFKFRFLCLLLLLPIIVIGRGPLWVQTDWVGGSGQDTWSNAAQYQSDDGHIESNMPTGSMGIKSKVDRGDGSDGSLVVSGVNTVINNYAYLTIDVASGNVISVSNGTNFQNGDEILIIQMHNPDSTTPGRYEFRRIASGGGTTTLALDSNLTNNYYSDRSSVEDTIVDLPGNILSTDTSSSDTNSSITQIIRIPQYTTITVSSGGSIVPDYWNGLQGGIVAFRSQGKVEIQNGGSVNADGRGYRGGDYASDGYRGEGWRGGNPQGGYNSAILDRRIQKYGGGGCYVNGAGGGYGTVGTVGDTYGGRPATAGLTYGDAALIRMFPGGAGAGGHSNAGMPHGGNGGGIIYIASDSLVVSGSGTISADGVNGYPIGGDGGQWGSGGGAGGSIRLCAVRMNLGAILVHANGGMAFDGAQASGDGGDGGVGRIHLDYGSLTGSTTPVAHTTVLDVYDSAYIVSSVYDGYSLGQTVSGSWLVTWNVTNNSGSVSIKVRTSNNSNMTGATNWALCNAVTSGTSVTSLVDVTRGERYLQYQTVLHLPSGGTSPVFDDITIEFNVPPNQFNLTSPAIGSEVSQQPLLQWTAATDSNIVSGDAVVYIVEIDDNQNFSSLTHRSISQGSSQYSVPGSANLLDNTTYYWRVWAIDSYPDSTISFDTLLFYVDVANESPTKSQPLNFSDNDEREPTDSLGWTRNDPDPGDTLTYHILIDNNSSFASAEIDTSFALTTRIALEDFATYGNLVDDQVYYMIVEADDPDNLNSGFTDLRNFYFNKVNDTVSQPFNLSPANGTQVDSAGYISWEVTDGDSIGNTPDTHNYTLQLSVNSNFSPIISNNPSLSVDSIQLEMLNNYDFLLDATIYYWRVQAIDNHGLAGQITSGSNYIEVLKSNNPPYPVSLTSPNSGQEIEIPSIINWSDAIDPNSDPVTYIVEIDDNSDFSSLELRRPGLNLSQYQIVSGDGLDGNATYYWRVFAKDNFPDSSVSNDTFSFTTPNTPPNAFSLIFPLHTVEINTTTPTLDWGNATDNDVADSSLLYIVEIDNDENFSSIIIRKTSLDSSRYIVTVGDGLIDNTRYFWRIYCKDTYPDSTLSSNTFVFYTDIVNESPTPPQPLNFTNNDVFSQTDSLGWTRNDPDPGDTLTYHLLIDTSSSFGTTVLDTTFDLTTRILLSDLTNYSQFIDDQKYYVLIEADDPDNLHSGLTDLTGFYFNKINDTVSLPFNLSPANGEYLDSTGYISWKITDGDSVGNTPDTHTYTLQLSVSQTFTPIISSNPGLTIDSIRLNMVNSYSLLVDETIYYWRVWATDNHGLSGAVTSGNNYFEVVKSNSAPSQVTLVSPINGSAQSVIPLLDWSDALDPNKDSIRYIVEIDNNNNFASIEKRITGLPVSQYQVTMLDGLEGNATYFWRVFAKDIFPDSSVSLNTLSFITLNNKPAEFSLSQPANGSEVSLTPLLSWQVSSDIDSSDANITYIVEIDTNVNFASLILRKTVSTSLCQIVAGDSLVDNTAYYWRVYARDTYPDSTLSSQSFLMYTDNVNNVPGLSTPLYPLNNTERSLTDSIAWTRNDLDPGDTVRYNIRLSTDVSFGTIIASKTNWLSENISIDSLDSLSNLADDVIYYWQVEAHDPSGSSSGFTQGTDYFYLNINNDQPSIPIDLVPVTNSTVSPSDFLRWKAMDGDSLGLTPDVLSYILVIDNNADFSSPLSTTSDIAHDSIQINTIVNADMMVDNVQYYWKIHALDNHGLSGGATDGSHSFWYNSSNDKPTMPTSLVPDPNASVVPSTIISWVASVDMDPYDTTSYIIQISSSKDFALIVIEDTTRLNSLQLNRLPGYNNIYTGMSYYWRVKGYDNQGAESGWAGGSNQRIVFVSTPPTIPLAIAPVDDQIYFPTEPIYWNKSVDDDAGVFDTLKYIIHISASAEFTTLLSSDTATDTVKTLSDLPGFQQFIDDSRYFWRVSCVDNHGAVSFWGDVNYFLLDKSNSSPTIPQPIKPHDSAVVMGVDTFNWIPSTDPDPGNSITYKILSSTDSLFRDTILYVEKIIPVLVTLDSLNAQNIISKMDFSQIPAVDTGGFLDNSFYFWKIAAVDNRNASSPYSEAKCFYSNIVNDTPSTPYALQPNFSAITFPTEFLTWHSDSNTEYLDSTIFIIQVSTDSLFASVILSQDTIKEIKQKQINKLNGYKELANESFLFWRVKSIDIAGNNFGFSNIAKFLFSLSNKEPTTPVGLYPTDSVAEIKPFDTLFWNTSIDQDNDSIYYELWISDILFDSTTDTSLITIKKKNIYSISKVLNTLDKGYSKLVTKKVYYWRLRARDEHYFYSKWSTVGMFRFTSTPPTKPIGLYPIDNTELSTDDYLLWNNAFDNDAGSNDTIQYSIIIDDNANFSSAISVDTIIMDSLIYLRSVVGINDFNDDTYYYWKVKSFDVHGAASIYSNPAIFYFNRTNTRPDTPHSLLPVAGSSIRPFQNLSWEATDSDLSDTLTCRIEIYSDTSAGIPLLATSEWPKFNIAINNFEGYEIQLVHGKDYCWRVQTTDSKGGLSDFSVMNTFTYDSWDDLATTPVIIAPITGSYMVGTTPIIWNNSIDEDDSLIVYHIDISPDSGFTHITAFQDSILTGSDIINNITSTKLSAFNNFSSMISNTFYYLRIYPLSRVDTIWVPGNTSDIFEIWYGDTLILKEPKLSTVNIIVPNATKAQSNIALSVDSLVTIIFPDSAVLEPVGVKISLLPITGTINFTDTSLIKTTDTSISRIIPIINNANKYTRGDERTYYTKEGAYLIELFSLGNPDSQVILSDSVLLQIMYHDTNNNNFIDGEERIPIANLHIARLNEKTARWNKTTATINSSKNRGFEKYTKILSTRKLPPVKNALSLMTNHFSVYTLFAFMEMTEPFANFKVYPSPLVIRNNSKATISYRLNEDADIEIRIFSKTGGLVWEKNIKAGSPGGVASTDQIQVYWDGRNMFGRIVGNGMYAIKIMAKPKTSGGIYKALQYIGIAK